MRVNAAYSSGVSRSSPADACSRVELLVSVPSIAALPARSGWARISASLRSRGAAYIAATSASWSSSRSANGRSCQAASATQGECSNSGPKRSTKATRSSPLIASMECGFNQGAAPPGQSMSGC